jgi:hypothetical protein
MRSLVIVSFAALMTLSAASAVARGWRDLRIDASSDASFTESVQQMRDELPYARAVMFVLVLQDLKAHSTAAECRQRLDGLGYKAIVRLGSPAVWDRYRAYYAMLHRAGGPDASGGFSAGTSGGFTSNVPNPFGAYPGFDQMTGQRLPAQ